MNKYLVFTAMGMELVGLILAALFLGNILEEKYNLKGLSIVGLSVVALAGWLVHIVALAKKLETDTKEPNE